MGAAGGASLRWTGSWLTVFAAADPGRSVVLSDTESLDLTRQLDRFRQAGREAWGTAPRYADLDLRLRICVARTSYRAEVEAAVLETLLGTPDACGGPRRGGFFDPDNFTFGTPLYRSRLEAGIQDVPGVRAVEDLRIRRRGWFEGRAFGELVFRPAADEVLRVEQDPLHPGLGPVTLDLEGGA